jgi:hypothetical protein
MLAHRDNRAPTPREIASISAYLAVLTVGAGAVWGFTVDDALIPARYAHHLATGRGYAFSPGGPATDGVTPLGFAHVLAPFARQGVAPAHLAAKWLGLVAWLAGGAMLAFAVARAGHQRVRYASLLVAALSLPAAAWAVAGLETGVVAGLVGVAVSLRSLGRAEPLGSLLLGLAAGWRPELAPMALVLGVPRAGIETRNVEDASLEGEGVAAPKFGLDRGHLARTLLVLTPLVLVAVARVVWFGQAAPLSSIAKRPSLDLGLVYAGSCALVAGPVAVVAPFALRRAPAFTRWLAIAVGTHLVAVAIAGGDWMPLSRLVVPCVPVVVVAVARLSDHATSWATALRVAIAIGLHRASAALDHVGARRRRPRRRVARGRRARRLDRRSRGRDRSRDRASSGRTHDEAAPGWAARRPQGRCGRAARLARGRGRRRALGSVVAARSRVVSCEKRGVSCRF